MTEETTDFLSKRSDLDFIRDVLVDALDQRRDDLVPRLFKMYEEMRTPSTFSSFGNINISTTNTDAGTEYNFNLNSDYLASPDVISFGDYKA